VAKPLKDKLQQQGLIVITKDGWRCAKEISEVLMKKASVDHRDLFLKLVEYGLSESTAYYYSYEMQVLSAVRNLRFYLYLGEAEKFKKNFTRFEDEFPDQVSPLLNLLFFTPFDKSWFEHLNQDIKNFVVSIYADYFTFNSEKVSFLVQLLQATVDSNATPPLELLQNLAEFKLMADDAQGAEALLTDDVSARSLMIKGSACFIDNRNDESQVCLASAIINNEIIYHKGSSMTGVTHKHLPL
jgi:hypothetical protein